MGDPEIVGGIAKNHDGTDPGTVAEGSQIKAIYDRSGRQYVSFSHPYFFQTAVSYSNSTSNSIVVTAPGTGLSLYVTDFIFSGSTIANFQINETTSTTARLRLDVGALNAGNLPFGHSFITPIKLTENASLAITSNATTTSFNVFGFIAP